MLRVSNKVLLGEIAAVVKRANLIDLSEVLIGADMLNREDLDKILDELRVDPSYETGMLWWRKKHTPQLCSDFTLEEDGIKIRFSGLAPSAKVYGVSVYGKEYDIPGHTIPVSNKIAEDEDLSFSQHFYASIDDLQIIGTTINNIHRAEKRLDFVVKCVEEETRREEDRLYALSNQAK